jgi:hypothetical protein
MRRGLALLLASLLIAACAAQISQPPGDQAEPVPALQGKSPDEAAQNSLGAYRQLVTEEDFAALGFESLDEVAKAELGPSLSVSLVPLERLRKFDPQSNPEDLLVDAGRVIFEVNVGGQLRSSLEVGSLGDLWQGQSFGSPALIGPLAKYRQSEGDFVVWVPALNVYFDANRTEQGILVTPAFDYPTMNLTAGRTLPASEAFAAMVELAKAQDGLPN